LDYLQFTNRWTGFEGPDQSGFDLINHTSTAEAPPPTTLGELYKNLV
jgi:hypothetical protein